MSVNQSRRGTLKVLSMVCISVPVSGLLPAQAATHDKICTTRFSNQALQGHDAVAYFTQSKPVKGKKSFSIKHQNAQWLFSSEENLQAFTDDPERFMPQFGGYCAFSIAQGRIVKGDATLWAVVDDKLYVNYNKGIHGLWLKRTKNLIAKAQGNWPTILG